VTAPSRAAFSPEHPLGIDLEMAGELVRAVREYVSSEELRAAEGLKCGEALELAMIWTAKEGLSRVFDGSACQIQLRRRERFFEQRTGAVR
jgi:hypothetical protein